MKNHLEKDLIKFIEHYEQHRETYKKWTPEQIAKTSIKNIFTTPSLPTDEEIKEYAKEWASTAHSKDSDRASTILESTEYENRRYNYYKGIKLGLSLRTNFSSEKKEGIDRIIELAFKKGESWGVTYSTWFTPAEADTLEKIKEAQQELNPPKQEQQTTK